MTLTASEAVHMVDGLGNLNDQIRRTHALADLASDDDPALAGIAMLLEQLQKLSRELHSTFDEFFERARESAGLTKE